MNGKMPIPMQVPLLGGNQRPTPQEMQQAAIQQVHMGIVNQVLPIVTGAHYGRWSRSERFNDETTPEARVIVEETQAIALEVLRSFGFVTEK